METNKSKIGVGILIGILIGLILGLGSFIIYDKVINKEPENVKSEDNTKEPNKENSTISYKIIEEDGKLTELLVNGKTVNGLLGTSIEVLGQLKDMLIVEVYSFDFFNYYAINSEAKVVTAFSGKNAVKGNSHNYNEIRLKGAFNAGCIISDNSLLCDSNNVQSEPTYISCNANDEDIIAFQEKINYLGNSNFSQPELEKTITAKQYRINNNITCDNQ